MPPPPSSAATGLHSPGTWRLLQLAGAALIVAALVVVGGVFLDLPAWVQGAVGALMLLVFVSILTILVTPGESVSKQA